MTRKKAAPYVAPVPAVTIAKPEKGSVSEAITISGYVEAKAMIPVVPFVSGTIISYPYKAGDYVEKDTVLAKIDDAPYRQQFLQAQAAYYGYESTFTRIENLYKSGATTQQNYDSAKAQYEASKAQYDLAKLQMEYTEVKAPVSGTILMADSAEGSIGATSQPLAVLANMEDLVVRLKVPEKYFDLFVTRKDEIRLTVTRPGIKGMYEDAVSEAVIENVAPYISAESKNFQVVCGIKEPGERFRPGMFIKVTASYANHEDVFVMPVTTRKLDGSCYLYDEDIGSAVFLEMKDVITDGKNFIVPDEYKNSWFITDGQNSVFDGQKVKVIE
ncbi:MAG: efflux RND transporter periplasmic adaptor subunit [Treponema sp.]|nr:efflux RND transporter periplasmic adaptor subunit [Treponema sp.]